MLPLINLLPWRDRERQRRRRQCLTILIIFLLAWGAATAYYLTGKYQQIAQIRADVSLLQRLAQVPVVNVCWSSVLPESVAVPRHVEHEPWGRRLFEVASLMPACSWLRTLKGKRGQLIVEGEITDASFMSEMDAQLRALPQVRQVMLGAASQHPDTGGMAFTFFIDYRG